MTKNPLNSSKVSQVSIPDFNNLKTYKLSEVVEEGPIDLLGHPVTFKRLAGS